MQQDMKLSEKGFAFLQDKESIKGYDSVASLFKPYDDGFGFMTIGYGHKIEPGENFDKGLTSAEITNFFKQDISRFENVIKNNINVFLSINQFDALVSLAYNIGETAFKKSAVAKYINNDNYKNNKYPDLESAWKAWNKARGKISKGLVNRRNFEWNLYKNGLY